jgi:UDPglucose 6-dehydrogenase
MNIDIIKICIFGLGFVGNSMLMSFKNKGMKENVNLFSYDKYKNNGIGIIENGLKSDIIFMALPTHYDEESGCYDKSSIFACCEYLALNNYLGLIVIKSTIEPETINNLALKYTSLSFVHNPEFLTARTAYEDFHTQSHIIIGKATNCDESKSNLLKSFYSKYYPNAEISMCTALESESMKIFCNTFYSIKVQFFTELYMLTKLNNSNYNNIVSMMLKNKWINPMHVQVPGPDGLISYGGLCFPKDTNALNKYMEKFDSPNEILKACINERNQMRDDHNNCIKIKKIITDYDQMRDDHNNCIKIKKIITD